MLSSWTEQAAKKQSKAVQISVSEQTRKNPTFKGKCYKIYSENRFSFWVHLKLQSKTIERNLVMVGLFFDQQGTQKAPDKFGFYPACTGSTRVESSTTHYVLILYPLCTRKTQEKVKRHSIWWSTTQAASKLLSWPQMWKSTSGKYLVSHTSPEAIWFNNTPHHPNYIDLLTRTN